MKAEQCVVDAGVMDADSWMAACRRVGAPLLMLTLCSGCSLCALSVCFAACCTLYACAAGGGAERDDDDDESCERRRF